MKIILEGLNSIPEYLYIHTDLLTAGSDDDPDEDKPNEGNNEQIKTRVVCNGLREKKEVRKLDLPGPLSYQFSDLKDQLAKVVKKSKIILF